MRILLVEDEPDIAEPLLALLGREGHEAVWARCGEEAWELFLQAEPALLILDVMLPEGPEAGFRLAEEVREGGYAGPILFLTARDGVEDRVRGLELGGDDYLIKPFHLEEFLARVRALFRRSAAHKGSGFAKGGLEVDFASKRVRYQGQEVALSAKAYGLLEIFCRNPDRLYTLDELADLLFPGRETGTAMVRVYVYRLRQRLGPEVIRTGPGGYGLGLSD